VDFDELDETFDAEASKAPTRQRDQRGSASLRRSFQSGEAASANPGLPEGYNE
jgi:hypothetical protein